MLENIIDIRQSFEKKKINKDNLKRTSCIASKKSLQASPACYANHKLLCWEYGVSTLLYRDTNIKLVDVGASNI